MGRLADKLLSAHQNGLRGPTRGIDLNQDRVRSIEDCLRAAGIRLPPVPLRQFISNIESDIASFSEAQSEGTFRETHDQLRTLWELAADCDPPPALIRGTIEKLSKSAMKRLNRRFATVAKRVVIDRPAPTDFRSWARLADAKKLIVVSRLLAAEGAVERVGRSRGGGKREEERLTPIIMGVARGDRTGAQKGGRPDNTAKQNLVLQLALSWLHATGHKPKPGRSDNTGFGKLVFLVFGWLGLLDEASDESGVHALRQYWSAVKSGMEAESRPDNQEEK